MLKYYADKRILASDRYGELKDINCPLQKRWDDLSRVSDSKWSQGQMERKRYCGACSQYVMNLDGLSEAQIEGACLTNPDICIHASLPHEAIQVVGEAAPYSCPKTGRRQIPPEAITIKTARSVAEINSALKRGLIPIIKPVLNNPEIQSKLLLIKDKDGYFIKSGDYRALFNTKPNKVGSDTLADEPSGFPEHYEFRYNPYYSPEPCAAYIVPPGIEKGQLVYLQDVIEDVVGETWNQGDVSRQQSGLANWNGKDFDLHEIEPVELIG